MNSHSPLQLYIISDFNAATLRDVLHWEAAESSRSVRLAPFGQVVTSLLNPELEAKEHVGLVWTSPASVAAEFQRALDFESVSESTLVSEVKQFANYLRCARERFRAILVMSWTLPAYNRGFGMLDLGKQFGLRNLLMRMNLTLAEELQRVSDVYLLDAQRWIEGAGQAAYNPKLWFLTKTPFHPEVFRRAADDIKAALRSLQGEAKKVIVLDLDNTLWGGIVGDVGWELLKIGGHDYIGEAYREFQLRLKALTRRGILLAICSHNSEEVALEALRQHPELVLRPEDFAARRINWHDKAANIVELAAELNVGLESMVFIDDNPTERGRVREALPEVLVPNWPEDPTQFATCLLQMDCFDVPAVSEEDAERGRMYSNRRCGQELKASLSSAEEWLAALQTQVSVEELTSANRSRVVQLLNKTNQLNLSTRRLHEGELLKWLEEGRRKLWAIRVSDRFGDSGLTGILTVEIQQGGAQLVDFLLSCRVMGRNIERVMLSLALNYCRSVGVDRLSAIYRPTARNKPCLEFLLDSRADYDASTQTFVWAVTKQFPVAEGIKVSFTPGAAITSAAQSAATQPCTADRHEHSSVAC